MGYEDYSIWSTKYQQSVLEIAKFEIKSYIGRLFFNKTPKDKGINLLNLGCGKSILNNFINTDFFSFNLSRRKKIDWMLDLRFKLSCKDNFFDGIFCEHVLEHLYPNQGLNLLNELNRTLKQGAWIRITVPDLKRYVDYYNGQTPHLKFKRWNTGCEAIRSLTQNWGHLSVWDSKLLTIFLKKSNYNNIKECSYRKGTDKRLLLDAPDRNWESLYIEAQK